MEKKFITVKEFKRAKICVVQNHENILLLQATDKYIPVAEFKEIFNFILQELVGKYELTSMIFDKQKLRVFHQPSMEWYFIEWKEKVFDKGLVIHRKILPDNKVFQQSVKLGRESINRKFPQGKHRLMDINYSASVEEAINELKSL